RCGEYEGCGRYDTAPNRGPVRGVPPWSSGGSGRAVAADVLPVAAGRQPAAVVDEEAARAGELVGLLRQHLDRELLAGQVGARQLEALRRLRLVDVHDRRLGLVATGLQLVERVLGQVVGFAAPRRVVVGRHRSHPLTHMSSSCGWTTP